MDTIVPKAKKRVTMLDKLLVGEIVPQALNTSDEDIVGSAARLSNNTLVIVLAEITSDTVAVLHVPTSKVEVVGLAELCPCHSDIELIMRHVKSAAPSMKTKQIVVRDRLRLQMPPLSNDQAMFQAMLQHLLLAGVIQIPNGVPGATVREYSEVNVPVVAQVPRPVTFQEQRD